MENKALISVIVPIYNVEKYLERCINSIIEQSYKNIEILLIDDGSSDKSGIICERYANIDNRIKVFHKQNGGLSSARNYGIEHSKGEYLMFIDSDDYIHQSMIEVLYDNSLKNDADIVTCQFVRVYDDGTLKNVSKKTGMYSWSGVEALEQMFFPDGVGWSACNKIYKRYLFDDVRYVEGVYCEDMATTYMLYSKCKKVLETSNKFYYYYMRSNSIMGQRSAKKANDSLNAIESILIFFNQFHPELVNCAEAYYGKIAPYHLVTLVDHNMYKEKQIKCVKAIRNYTSKTINASFVKSKYKIFFAIFRLLIGNKRNILEKKWFILLCHKLNTINL